MTRDEKTTCIEIIEPALTRIGWDWRPQLHAYPGRVNLKVGLLADTLLDSGRREEAVKVLEEALSLEPGSARLEKKLQKSRKP